VRYQITEDAQWMLAKSGCDELMLVRPRSVRVVEAGYAWLDAELLVSRPADIGRLCPCVIGTPRQARSNRDTVGSRIERGQYNSRCAWAAATIVTPISGNRRDLHGSAASSAHGKVSLDHAYIAVEGQNVSLQV
jgi:hypothetical protein